MHFLFNLSEISNISSFTGIHPLVVDINWFRKEINFHLKIFKTFRTLNSSSISLLVHSHLTGFFMIAKWTIKNLIQDQHISSWRSLAL